LKNNVPAGISVHKQLIVFEVYIHNLRKKIGNQLIKNIRGVG